MKKLCTFLTAGALAAALCAPALAASSSQIEITLEPVKLPFTDVAKDRWSYNAVRYCWLEGLVAGKTEDRFDPAGQLTVDQAVALAARLYSAAHGEKGEVPALPRYTVPYARFLAEDGSVIAELTPEKGAASYNAAGLLFVGLSESADDASLPQSCTLELGYQGYDEIKTYQGTRVTFVPTTGTMTQGLSGTGYRFQDAAASEQFLDCLNRADSIPPFARLYDEDGKQFASISLDGEGGLQVDKGEQPEFSGAWNAMGEKFYLALSGKTDDPAIYSPTCTMEVGFEGYGDGVKTYQGTRRFYDFQGGHMSYGLVGTGYDFEPAAGKDYLAIQGCDEVIHHYDKDAWWAPYAFYLTYHTGLRMDGGVIYQLRQSGQVTDWNAEISSITAQFSQYPADRMMFAWLVDHVTQDMELEAINTVDYIPDVTMDQMPIENVDTDASIILRLYRAGIFTGVDDTGRFGGTNPLTREQTAAILARVLDPAQRVKLEPVSSMDDPEAPLTQAEALAITLKLYDQQRGGSGELEKAPDNLRYLTFTAPDGAFLNGWMGETYGFSSFIRDGNADAHLYYYIPDVSEAGLAAARSWEGKPCTITVAQTHVCTGTMKLWQPDGVHWALSFYPDKDSDQFLLRGLDADQNTTTDNWRRDVNYTAWKWWDRDGVQFQLAKEWHTQDVPITREAWIQALSQVADPDEVAAFYQTQAGTSLDPQGVPTRAEAHKLAEQLAK